MLSVRGGAQWLVDQELDPLGGRGAGEADFQVDVGVKIKKLNLTFSENITY